MKSHLLRAAVQCWIYFAIFHTLAALTIESPEEYKGVSYNTPRFLLSVRDFSLSGQLVVVDNGCAPITADVEGLIVLVRYNSSCLLFEEILNAQNAKARVSRLNSEIFNLLFFGSDVCFKGGCFSSVTNDVYYRKYLRSACRCPGLRLYYPDAFHSLKSMKIYFYLGQNLLK